MVTDLEPDAAEKYAGSVRTFFGAVTGKWETARRRVCHGQGTAQPRGIPQAGLDRDLPALHSEAWRWPYSLGEHLDVLIQESTLP